VASAQAEARRRHAATVEPKSGAAAGSMPESLEEGMQVYVRSLGRTGEILSVDGNEVRVRLGRMPFTVDRRELRTGGPDEKSRSSPPPRRGEPGDDLERAAPTELMLIGQTVDEGLEELDRFLDVATLAGLGEVRVVHGHGTGRLRKAVRKFLNDHAQVRSYRSGRPAEGGDGATVVTLR
jgi:DNA mismatch repair protein MutS2